MRIQACESYLVIFGLAHVSQCLPGRQINAFQHYHTPRAVLDIASPVYAQSASSITPPPPLAPVLARRNSEVVTIICNGSTSCGAYDISLSLITVFNPSQFTASDWCVGPGCDDTTSIRTATGASSPDPSNTSSTDAPFANATDTASNTPSRTVLGTGSTPIGTRPMGTHSPNVPSSLATSRGPFANGTNASQPHEGPAGTGSRGPRVTSELTTTLELTSTVTIAVTAGTDEPWVAWTNSPLHTAGNISKATSVIKGTPVAQSRIPQPSSGLFKSTATYTFVDHTVLIPVPASFTSSLPPPDSDEQAVARSSIVNAVTDPDVAPQTTSAPLYQDGDEQSFYITSSCHTTKLYKVVTSATGVVLLPTASASVCYGIVCDATHSCHDWLSRYPFTDATANATSFTDVPYTNSTKTSTNDAITTGTGGGGFYSSETGTDITPSPRITDSPWPSSLDTTRNPAAYTQTAANVTLGPNGNTVSASSTAIGPTSITTLFVTSVNAEGFTISAPYTTITITPAKQQPSFTSRNSSDTAVAQLTTSDNTATHPWILWPATKDVNLPSSTVDSATPATRTSDNMETEGEGNADNSPTDRSASAALFANNKLAVLKARRAARLQTRHEDLQEKKHDAILQKKISEWTSEKRINSEELHCPDSFTSCWLSGLGALKT